VAFPVTILLLRTGGTYAGTILRSVAFRPLAASSPAKWPDRSPEDAKDNGDEAVTFDEATREIERNRNAV
jgi:hypothetical protein